jgi:hypothetical protein
MVKVIFAYAENISGWPWKRRQQPDAGECIHLARRGKRLAGRLGLDHGGDTGSCLGWTKPQGLNALFVFRNNAD